MGSIIANESITREERDFYQGLYREHVRERPKIYRPAFELVNQHAKGGFWVIGGDIIGNLAKKLYGGVKEGLVDLDFFVQYPLGRPINWDPDEWEFEPGNLCLRYTHIKVPYFQVDINFAMRPLLRMGLPHEIKDLLEVVPLTSQSIAYNPVSRVLQGNIGMQALNERHVEVNNLDELLYECNHRQPPIDPVEFIRKKARKLGFSYEIPEELKRRRTGRA